MWQSQQSESTSNKVGAEIEKLHFSPVSLYTGTIWSTTDNVGAEIALFASQHVYMGDHLEHQ